MTSRYSHVRRTVLLFSATLSAPLSALLCVPPSAFAQAADFGMKAFIPAVTDEVRLMIQVEGFKD